MGVGHVDAMSRVGGSCWQLAVSADGGIEVRLRDESDDYRCKADEFDEASQPCFIGIGEPESAGRGPGSFW